MKMYLVWNMTNYGDGYEFYGLYNTKENAKKAYDKHMKELFGTTDKDELGELWEDSETGDADSWKIDEVEIKD